MKHSFFLIASIVLLISGCCGDSSDEEYRGIYNYDGKIAFVSDRSGSLQVYTMDNDGSNQTLISQGLDQASCPVWSPNGSKLAFNGKVNEHRNIYIVNPDGSNPIQITDLKNIHRNCDWSPDGSRIAFIGWDEDLVPKIYIINSDGSNQVSIFTLTDYYRCQGDTEYGSIFNVDWSPDGTKILTVSYMEDCGADIIIMDANGDNITYLATTNIGNANPTWSPGGSEILFYNNDKIMKMNADGSDQIILANLHSSLNAQIPFWSPDGSKIAYYSASGSSSPYEKMVMIMNNDGSNQTNLTSDIAGPDYFGISYPWSPEGSKIAFNGSQDGSSAMDIYIMNTDGSRKTNLSNNEAHDIMATWQPLPPVNLVFSRFTSEGNNEIYKMNSDGSNQIQLTNGEYDRNIACSPDGSKIAFFRGRGSSRDIWIMNDDGSEQRSLTDGLSIHGKPAWSCDGSKIAFSTLEDGDYEIYTIRHDGSELTKLTDQTGSDGGYPSWHPDGSKIAFFSGRDGNHEIYVMNADGSNQTNLTNSYGSDIKPKWSPNGDKIAFISTRNGEFDVIVMDSDGSDQINLSNSSSSTDVYPSWSPDGSKIAFQSNRDGNEEIYIVNADGSELYNLTNHPADDGGNEAFPYSPLWSPDGCYIIFPSNRNNNTNLYKIYIDGTGLTRLTDAPLSDKDPNWLVIPR